MAETKEKKKKVRTRAQEDRNYDFFFTIVRIIWFFLFPIRVHHYDRLPEGPCIVCPNHTSWADPPMAAVALRRKSYPKIMAKKSLLSAPIIGPMMEASGTFGVDRGANDVGAIKNALRALKDGYKLLMFPEGTRVSSADDVQGDAKKGAIMFAMKTGAPLVPVFMTRKKRMFRRSDVVFGEPYTVKSAGKRPTQEEYEREAEELLRRIYALEAEIK